VQGIAECERALELDRNLALAHGSIGIAKIFSGRAEECEAHFQEALRLSPRDNDAFRWLSDAGAGKH
jgi:tetratricopeptide (TPR) repeat protein